jgi:phenylpropionate dioxygenase-like ring-hydroxylating dioxygenase large terminal subunit
LDTAWTVGDWAESPRGLAPATYVSEDCYRLEVERVLRPGWLLVGRADEVARPGDFLSVDLLGEPLVMVRDAGGVVRVLSRVCRHRGMPVVADRGHARRFVCPYHAWTYALDGRLLAAPEMDRTPGFDPAGCRLPGIRTEVWQGFVFVNLDGGAPPLGPSLSGLEPVVHAYDLAGMTTARSIPFEMECDWNWKLMCENFMEPYHHLGTHRKSLEPHMPARRAVTLDSDGPYSVVHMRYREGGGDGEGWGVSYLPAIPGLAEAQAAQATLIHVYPLGLITLLADHVEFYRVLPDGPGRVGLEKLVCVARPALADPALEAGLARLVQGFETIRDEDVAICRAVQRGLASRLAEPGRLAHLERPIWQFARWLDGRIRAGAAEARG